MMYEGIAIMIRLLVILLIGIANTSLYAQSARLILNGADITISDGATLVITNPSPNAITRNSGSIISEGQNNRVIWYIGETAGLYSIPWKYTGPLSFSTSAGTGNGYFVFSTYYTGSWENSILLPEGITNFNGTAGADRSAFAIDRFWQINAQGYTSKPVLTNLTFTYQDSEHTQPDNTIDEGGLLAQRWNPSLSTWTDMTPAGTSNVTANTVTVATVGASDLHPWWTLTTLASNYYWAATTASSWNSAASWSATQGGSGGAGIPGDIDVAIFDGSKNGECIIDADVSLLSLWVQPGFNGTINQGAHKITTERQATFSGGTFSGGSESIEVGSNFTISGGQFTSTTDTLDVKGNFTVSSGTFLHNNGTVKFSGAAASVPQIINSSLVNTFNNIHVANAATNAGVRIESDQDLRGILSLGEDALFDADGSGNTEVFRLLSTSDSPTDDAAIAALPEGARVDGSITVQRHMSIEGPNNTRIYRYISAPVKDATVLDLQQEIPVTGSFSGSSVCSGCTQNTSMYAYDETVLTDTDGDGDTDLDDGFYQYPRTSNTELLEPGVGYAMFVRGNIISSALWDLRGPVTMANVTPFRFELDNTPSDNEADDGWNLVGNPFPSAINWDATSWTKTNLEASIYIRDDGSPTGVFATWNGVTGTNGGSRYIATGQAFWIKADGEGTPELLATEGVKAPREPTVFFREDLPENLLRIKMVRAGDADEAVIHFRDDATPAFDRHADARKLSSNDFNLATLAETGEKVSINSWSALSCKTSIDVAVYDAKPGSYQLHFSSLESFDQPVTFTLQDHFLHKTVRIGEGSVYDFAVTTDPASAGTERFVITADTAKPLEIQVDGNVLSVPQKEGIQWYFNGTPIDGATSAILQADESGSYEVFVADGACGLSGNVNLLITGIEELTEAAVHVYPNPTDGQLMVELPATPQPWQVTLINPLGQECSSISVVQRGIFDLRHEPPGVYIVRINGGRTSLSVKVVRKP